MRQGHEQRGDSANSIKNGGEAKVVNVKLCGRYMGSGRVGEDEEGVVTESVKSKDRVSDARIVLGCRHRCWMACLIPRNAVVAWRDLVRDVIVFARRLQASTVLVLDEGARAGTIIRHAQITCLHLFIAGERSRPAARRPSRERQRRARARPTVVWGTVPGLEATGECRRTRARRVGSVTGVGMRVAVGSVGRIIVVAGI